MRHGSTEALDKTNVADHMISQVRETTADRVINPKCHATLHTQYKGPNSTAHTLKCSVLVTTMKVNFDNFHRNCHP